MSNLNIDLKTLNFEKSGGLISAVVQDVASGAVLMVGFQNRDAVEKSLKTGKVTFFSRTKNRLWTKGEVSKNFLEIVDATVDCDSDAILWTVRAPAETCHAGKFSCFGKKIADVNFLTELAGIIRTRKIAGNKNSYIRKLLNRGLDRIAQKLGEEAIETVIAAKNTDDAEFISESADLLFHFLILCEAKNIPLQKIIEDLKNRQK